MTGKLEGLLKQSGQEKKLTNIDRLSCFIVVREEVGGRGREEEFC